MDAHHTDHAQDVMQALGFPYGRRRRLSTDAVP
jgi:hypothetical protein